MFGIENDCSVLRPGSGPHRTWKTYTSLEENRLYSGPCHQVPCESLPGCSFSVLFFRVPRSIFLGAGHLEIQGKQYRLLREGPLAPSISVWMWWNLGVYLNRETPTPISPMDPHTFSEGDWRHCYVGAVVGSSRTEPEVRYDWIPREVDCRLLDFPSLPQGRCRGSVLPKWATRLRHPLGADALSEDHGAVLGTGPPLLVVPGSLRLVVVIEEYIHMPDTIDIVESTSHRKYISTNSRVFAWGDWMKPAGHHKSLNL